MVEYLGQAHLTSLYVFQYYVENDSNGWVLHTQQREYDR